MRSSSEVQRQRILDASMQVFARHGFAGARVDQIAAAAGVNKRMLYHHVGAKAELFAAVLADQAGRLSEQSLGDQLLWALLLEEANHSDRTVLLDALVADQLNRSPSGLERRLSSAMFQALLPRAAKVTAAESAAVVTTSEPEPDPGSDSQSGDQRKPRLRMMPQVTASGVDSTRSSENRSK